MKKQLELIARERVKKKLWKAGIKAKSKHFPVDIEIERGLRVAVSRVDVEKWETIIDKDKLKYCDFVIIYIPILYEEKVLFADAGNFSGGLLVLDEDNIKLFRPLTRKILKTKPKSVELPPVELLADEWYTPKDIAKHDLMGEYSLYLIRKFIKNGTLKSTAVGSDKRRRHWIKGEWIIKAKQKIKCQKN